MHYCKKFMVITSELRIMTMKVMPCEMISFMQKCNESGFYDHRIKYLFTFFLTDYRMDGKTPKNLQGRNPELFFKVQFYLPHHWSSAIGDGITSLVKNNDLAN